MLFSALIYCRVACALEGTAVPPMLHLLKPHRIRPPHGALRTEQGVRWKEAQSPQSQGEFLLIGAFLMPLVLWLTREDPVSPQRNSISVKHHLALIYMPCIDGYGKCLEG